MSFTAAGGAQGCSSLRASRSSVSAWSIFCRARSYEAPFSVDQSSDCTTVLSPSSGPGSALAGSLAFACRPRASRERCSGGATRGTAAGQLQPAAVHRAQDVRVAGAAAVVARQIVDHVVIAGVGVLVEEAFHGEDVPG